MKHKKLGLPYYMRKGPSLQYDDDIFYDGSSSNNEKNEGPNLYESRDEMMQPLSSSEHLLRESAKKLREGTNKEDLMRANI